MNLKKTNSKNRKDYKSNTVKNNNNNSNKLDNELEKIWRCWGFIILSLI